MHINCVRMHSHVLDSVTREHYAKLITDTEPFTCQYCTLRTYRATVVQLQSDVENLKSELASMKAALQPRTPERRTENIPTFESKSEVGPKKKLARNGMLIQGQSVRERGSL